MLEYHKEDEALLIRNLVTGQKLERGVTGSSPSSLFLFSQPSHPPIGSCNPLLYLTPTISSCSYLPAAFPKPTLQQLGGVELGGVSVLPAAMWLLLATCISAVAVAILLSLGKFRWATVLWQ